MPNIIPVKELKNATALSIMCHEQNEPIFITKNGYGDMVIMSMEVYEQLTFKKDLYTKMEAAEKQVEYGHVKDFDLTVAEMKQKYGL